MSRRGNRNDKAVAKSPFNLLSASEFGERSTARGTRRWLTPACN